MLLFFGCTSYKFYLGQRCRSISQILFYSSQLEIHIPIYLGKWLVYFTIGQSHIVTFNHIMYNHEDVYAHLRLYDVFNRDKIREISQIFKNLMKAERAITEEITRLQRQNQALFDEAFKN